MRVIDLYYWPTPNGWKVTIMLEELGWEYNVIPVNILEGEQFDSEFLARNPNHKIPVLVDPDGPGSAPITVFESGAILIYLAEKADRFFAPTARGKYEVLEWLMFQLGGVGPFFGQANHFNRYAPEQVPYALERYNNEAKRLMGVMDRRLDGRDWFAGEYSIADIAMFGWVRDYPHEAAPLENFPNLKRWYDAIAARPSAAPVGFSRCWKLPGPCRSTPPSCASCCGNPGDVLAAWPILPSGTGSSTGRTWPGPGSTCSWRRRPGSCGRRSPIRPPSRSTCWSGSASSSACCMTSWKPSSTAWTASDGRSC